MFKPTIASSGKYLALWQIKPIGLHDGHLVGGRIQTLIFFLSFFFVRGNTIRYFWYFSASSS